MDQPQETKSKLPYEVTSFAQNREDLILYWLIGQKNKGFYVDVGANDPQDDFSVTRFFYELGWVGINIEPIPRLFEKLQLHRPKDINLMLGAAEKKGELEFREYLDADGLSTFSENDKKRVGDKYKFKEFKVPTDTLTNIFSKYIPADTKIDFMKVDVEGFEYEVLAGNNWDKYRPYILCIEANHVVKDWRSLIKEAGYKLVFFDGLNEYWTLKAEEVVNRFKDYADIFLSGRIIEQQRTMNSRLQQLEKFREAERKNSYILNENNGLRQQAETLRKDIDYLTSLNIKQALLMLLKSIYRGVRYRTLKIIWGSMGYENTGEIKRLVDTEIKSETEAKHVLSVLVESDKENLKLVTRHSKFRRYVYEILRRVAVILRKLYRFTQKRTK